MLERSKSFQTTLRYVKVVTEKEFEQIETMAKEILTLQEEFPQLNTRTLTIEEVQTLKAA